MALVKTPIPINFAQGLDLKTDNKQVSLGKFLRLENSIFTKAGLLTKRNGFGPLSSLPTTTFKYITTMNNGLVAIGESMASYAEGPAKWVDKGTLQLAELDTMPLVRSSTNQTYGDSAIASNGLICTAFIDVGASTAYKYTIADSATGQVVVAPTIIVPGSGTINTPPSVFVLGAYFLIVFSTATTIQRIAIPTSNPTAPLAAVNITAIFDPTADLGIPWCGKVYNDRFYLVFYSTTGGSATKMLYLTSTLTLSSVISYSSSKMHLYSISVDPVRDWIYVIGLPRFAFNSTYLFIVNLQLGEILSPINRTGPATSNIVNITSVAHDDKVDIYYDISGNYTGPGASTSSIQTVSITSAGVVSSVTTVARGVGLASKAFRINDINYMLVAFGSSFQPSYFLMNGSGQVIAKFAYSNGGGYYSHLVSSSYITNGLPNYTVDGNVIKIPYLIKDLISGINKGTAITPTATAPVSSAIASSLAAVYSQTGVNLVTIDLDPETVSSAEIGGTLNISGGLLWSYDGTTPVEQGFNLFPDDIQISTSTASGSLAAGTYYYQVTYEWADNNGNVIRSAPSIPIKQVTTTSGSTNTLIIPTLRLSYKTDVKIVVYRWSSAQQVYYALKSPAVAPTLNDPTVNDITVVDALADTSILGNPILYTTGGVIENVGAPATNNITLFNNRLWLIDAEDRNLLWYSKQVIEATPVEMSDLLTIYVAPTTGAQGSTGPMTAIAPMDDKIITFKKDAIYYISGVGPDNTGSNSQYSDATFVSSVVGCDNQNSIVFTPAGLMFESDKGIWLLDRGLNTSYIGAPVEDLTKNATVRSALAIPGTNQVRFTMSSGVTIMYDYYFQQWGTFAGIPNISSTLYEGLHTFINSYGQVLQETPSLYLDNSKPVLMSFTTGWGNLAGLQGYERLYFFFLLGQYLTPFKLNVAIAYDYASSPSQTILVTPDNYSPAYGGDALWGSGTTWGGTSKVFESRIFPEIQKCESFQISVQEIYDPTYGVTAGAGLTLSGLEMVVGAKRAFRTSTAGKSFG